MRLPRTPRIGTQSLGREDVNAPARQWQAEANTAATLVEGVSDSARFIGGLIEAKQNQETALRAQSLKRDLAQSYNAIANKETYDLNNPEDVELLKGSQYKKADAQGNLRTTIGREEVMAQVWSNKRDTIREQGFADLSGQQVASLEKTINPVIDGLNLNTQENSIKFKSAALKKELLTNSQELLDAGDVNGSIKLIADAPYFTDAHKTELIEKVRVQGEKNNVQSAKLSNNPGEILGVKNKLEDDNYAGVLSDQERNAAIATLNGAYKVSMADKVAKEKEFNAKNTAIIEVGVDRGTLSYDAINEGLQSGFYDWNKWATLTKKADDVTKAQQKDAFYKAKLADITTGRVSFNPANTDHTKMADDAAKNMQPDQLEAFAYQSGYVAQPLQDIIESNAINGDGLKALEIYQRFDDAMPTLLAKLDSRATDVLSLASELTRGGEGAEKAIETARELILQAPEIKEQRGKEYAVLSKKPSKELSDFMDADGQLFDLGGGWNADIAVPSDMDAEFKRLTNRYFMYSGDFESSQRIAYNNLKKTWGISGVGNKMVEGKLSQADYGAKFSPERMLNATTLQANNALKAFAFDQNIPFEKIIITPTHNTSRGVAEYTVALWNDETETPSLIRDSETNTPLLWNASEYMSKGAEQAKMKAKADELVESGEFDEETGKTSDAYKHELYSISNDQFLINKQLKDLESLDDMGQYKEAQDILENKNASPEQIREANKVIDKAGKSLYKAGKQQNLGPKF